MEARDRRRQPRFEIRNEVQAFLAEPWTAVTIRDIGPGGFSAEAPFPFVPGHVHQFRFTVTGPWSVVLPVSVVHSRPTEAGRHVTGFTFVATPDRDHVVAELIDGIASVLTAGRP